MADGSRCDSFDSDGATHFQKVLKVCVCILVWFSTECNSLHHTDRYGWISKSISLISTCGPNEIWVAEGDEKSAMGWLTIDILILGAKLPSLSEFKCELDL